MTNQNSSSLMESDFQIKKPPIFAAQNAEVAQLVRASDS